MHINSRSATRRNALERLGALATKREPGREEDDIERLCELWTPSGRDQAHGGINSGLQTAAVPMDIRELEVLLALCKAAPAVEDGKDADRLLAQLQPYLPEAHKQAFARLSMARDEAPWEPLSFDLTSAILALGNRHESLRSRAHECFEATLQAMEETARDLASFDPAGDGHKQVLAIQLTTSMVGFLEAAAQHIRAWPLESRTSLLDRLRSLISSELMVAVERALTAVRKIPGRVEVSKEYRRWIKQYAAKGRPLGAMILRASLMAMTEASVAALIQPGNSQPSDMRPFDSLLQRASLPHMETESEGLAIQQTARFARNELLLLDAEDDYLQLSSPRHHRFAMEVKASCFRTHLYCLLLSPEAAIVGEVIASLNETLRDLVEMADENIAVTVPKCIVLLARSSSSVAYQYSRELPRLLVQGRLTSKAASAVGHCLAQVLTYVSQDTVISVIYSLGNVLSGTPGAEKPANGTPFAETNGSLNTQGAPFTSHQGSVISLVTSDEEEIANVHSTVIQSVVAIAVASKDERIVELAAPLLYQKIGRISPAVDARIITEAAALGVCGEGQQFSGLLKFYSRVSILATAQHDDLRMRAVSNARLRLSASIRKSSPLYEIYLTHLLSLIVSSGDVDTETRTSDPESVSRTIAHLLRPLAILMSNDSEGTPVFNNEDVVQSLNRDVWFNMAVHGYTLHSKAYRDHVGELQTLAQHSLPFIDEERADMPESGIDLNTVLRRGAGPRQAIDQKAILISSLPACESEIKGLGHAECVYLNAALLACFLRARAGDCTFVLAFFLEGKVKTTAMGTCMLAITKLAVTTYLQRALAGRQQEFAAPKVALQLRTFFEGCCHRIAKVQQAAVQCADLIIHTIPSALCQKASIFAMLELLTLLWRGCLDVETDEYSITSSYSSERGNVSLLLSDDFALRQNTLKAFQQKCRTWIALATDSAPLDVKGLLQAYLEDFDDDGTYGHIALGRSFAVEMGSTIPASDQRLASIDRQNTLGISTASDFVAQYTTRQEYRALESFRAGDDDPVVAVKPTLDVDDEIARLRQLSRRSQLGESLHFADVRTALQSAAAFLSKTRSESISLIQDLVGIPFKIFSKQSINFGISLWMGIIKENPSLQSRVLVEVAAGWEASIRVGRGFFHPSTLPLDPFYIKEEFAPSNHEALVKRQQAVHNMLAPHLRLAQCLSSAFHASRLTAPSIERLYTRLIRITLHAMKHTVVQPLARELHFHLVLLASKVLRYSTSLDTAAQWRLKDAVLSAGLAWFAAPPKWSYGSNRLQVKAEIKLLGDVINVLQSVASIGSAANKSLPSLQNKQDLLLQLLSHEIGRLTVWITPLSTDSKGIVSTLGHAGNTKEGPNASLVFTAWAENPHLAVQLVARYHSQRLATDVRRLLLNEPQRAITEPDALNLMLGSNLPSDLKSQLKYLLYWSAVNPMAAVTYFLPAFGNHPLLIQYAVRALESHHVDVTFFYVPQIVQSLRYDALGYVERYIIEAAKFSQLFAHQIIWNMKANAYKDEESQEPDPVKPVLDRVMDALIASFSLEDKDFYEREFDFFGKVTGISGTLKPFIKRPKPEKKQKIEEELRKIQVDVGVYLPSNPDGVVIGIDRKSGKPLQSHAKAPYMATFRIRKEAGEDLEDQMKESERSATLKTYDVWQSAIFKVGDDCRQDVLALQMIAAFRGIFNSVGLDVYVFPYRVTATAPGCGVIDVLPNSTSRDMLGREAVNDLYQYFVSKYGSEDSLRFQQARSNFIKSMAAYSIISYLLQFKDRHNGNIMVDDAGHILHIDFGFCFDIAPGGIKFERAPFKLTPEMVAVMGGSPNSQPFKVFEELIVKAFLASRQYVEQLSHIVLTMLDSGLPCFKPHTIQHFKERFVLEKSDREAAEFVRKLVHWSERSYSTGVYDYFQLLTNGIPYKS